MAKLREEGEEVPEDEQEAALEVRKRQKENQKEKSSVSGAAPKKKRRTFTITTAARFRAPSPLLFPKGSKYDVSPADPRVVWEIKQIYAHLSEVFGRDQAAVKMDILTAATTDAAFLAKSKRSSTTGSRRTLTFRAWRCSLRSAPSGRNSALPQTERN